MVMGTTFAPSLAATVKAPRLKVATLPSSLRVPSGKKSREQPARPYQSRSVASNIPIASSKREASSTNQSNNGYHGVVRSDIGQEPPPGSGDRFGARRCAR